ncbi:MAG: tRNA uracil 4-sulfurtransferase ThiI [Myxococcota bacterium]
MQTTDILVHYAEIALKGKNRPLFIKRLVNNIRLAMRGLPIAQVHSPTGRLWIRAQPGEYFSDEAFTRLKTVYGIASFSPVVRTELDMQAMKEAALALVQNRHYESFRVTSRRAFKQQPLSSMQVNEEVGAYLWEHKPAKVRMKGADIDVRIEMVPNGAYLYVDKIKGLGGLPVGVTGKVCALLSGGIDSPVAAFRMMRRGCRVCFVHFHSHPFVSKASLEKAQDLAEHLVRHQYDGVLYAVAFGELQRRIVERAPPALRVVLYRRFMVRIAAAIARQEGAEALVTGESLAQVASQTLTNMVVIDNASTLPILRPLIGMDKSEIVEQAQDLGTFETSILPDQDCCSLFIPKSPETRANLRAVEHAESSLEIDDLVTHAIAEAERREIHAPWWQPKGHKNKSEQLNSAKPEALTV